MELIIGLAAGAAVGWLCARLKPTSPKQQTKPPASPEQRRLQHEYQNFLNYTGEQQEEFQG